jgi:hypothetical protein
VTFFNVLIFSIAKVNLTTPGGPYTYDISDHHFWGIAYDGSKIDTKSCCCGSAGSCSNNPSCTCQKNVGPLPQGAYTLGNMFTYKGSPNSYQLFPASSNNMCGRSEFLIRGGNCESDSSSIGSIVIASESTRYLIQSGAILHVQA